MRTIVCLDRLDRSTVCLEFTNKPEVALYAAAALARADAEEVEHELRDDADQEAAALRSLADDIDHYAETAPLTTTVDDSYGWHPHGGGTRPRLRVWHVGQPAPTDATIERALTGDRERSCDDRIDDVSADRLADLAVLVALVQADDDPDTISEMTVGELARAQGLGVELPDLLIEQLDGQAPDTTAEDMHAARFGITESQPDWPEEYTPLCDLLRDEGTGCLADSARERLDEYALCIDVETTRVVRWVFSTGGPHDEIEMAVDRGQWSWDIDQATFVFKDWFDGARKPLTGDELETVRQAAEIVGITEPGSLLPERDDVA